MSEKLQNGVLLNRIEFLVFKHPRPKYHGVEIVGRSGITLKVPFLNLLGWLRKNVEHTKDFAFEIWNKRYRTEQNYWKKKYAFKKKKTWWLTLQFTFCCRFLHEMWNLIGFTCHVTFKSYITRVLGSLLLEFNLGYFFHV